MAYLEYLPPSRVSYEWDRVWRSIRAAAKLDPLRDKTMVQLQALYGQLQFWRPGAPMRGHVVTQFSDGACWVIYAAGFGSTIAEKRNLMALIEQMARDHSCSEVKFEGRDWRRVFPDYSASQAADGRWNFRKAL